MRALRVQLTMQVEGFNAPQRELSSIIQDPELSFDRPRISVYPKLMCLEPIGVMNELVRWKPIKIDFAPAE
jgi:hypothetical protein